MYCFEGFETCLVMPLSVVGIGTVPVDVTAPHNSPVVSLCLSKDMALDLTKDNDGVADGIATANDSPLFCCRTR